MKSKAIEWPKVHARLAASRQALETSLQTGAQECARILAERAAVLAAGSAVAKSRARAAQALMFQRGEMHFVLELAHVRQVCRLPACTPLPGAPAAFVGLANFAGQVRSVIDLLPLLGQVNGQTAAANFGIVVGYENTELVLTIDLPEQVLELPEELVVALPEPIHEGVSLARGSGPANTTVLDIAKVFACCESLLSN